MNERPNVFPAARKTAFLAAALLICASGARAAKTGKDLDLPSQGLPLRTVSLFSSGVGYFGRAGKISGDRDVELFFQRDDLNDVLKSLVITDASGELRPANYSLDELLARRPANNDLTLPNGGTLGEILRNFQGALIEISNGQSKTSGRLLGVATKSIRDKNGDVTTTDIANILGENGLSSVRLDLVENGGIVRLLDAKLNRKLNAQLENSALKLTSSVDAGFRPLTLHFAGKGEREVKAGYIQATSVWKTSYRLVFDSPKNAAKTSASSTRKNDQTAKNATKSDLKSDLKSDDIRPLLQGWAIVENTTDEDWRDVSLSLIAGRPVSFSMDMAAPLYVQRPEIALPFAGAPRSQVYEEAAEREMKARPAPRLMDAPIVGSMLKRSGGIFSNAGNFEGRADYAARDDAAVSATEMARQQSGAATAERGELFEYSIRQPVSLKRGEAAMVPIVSEAITGDKLTILDTREPVLQPLYGLRLCNTTGLHLAGGPLTIYQDGLYAGDAQITNIAPGDNRLVSYALDLDMIAARQSPTFTENTFGLAVGNGFLSLKRKQRQTQIFSLRNKAASAKTVLLQIPIDTNFTLVEPAKSSEKSPTEYRFEVAVAARETTLFRMQSERTVSETVAIFDADINALVAYSQNSTVSPALKTALQGVVNRRNSLRDLQNRHAGTQARIKEIGDEQTRIRQNMNALDKSSALYKLYVSKLTKQESQIETLRAESARLSDQENDAKRALNDYIQNLNLNS